MYDLIKKLLPLLEPPPDSLLGDTCTPSYLERFLDVNAKLNRGTMSPDKPARVAHPHCEKVDILRGIFSEMSLQVTMYTIVDVWEQRYASFHAFVRSPSRYGGFDQPMLRHMMAEQVVKDTVWYRKARADPKVHLPRLYRFLNTPRIRAFAEKMTEEKKVRFERRGAAFLEAAEAKHLKWNGTKWTTARYLLGILCLEERREMFASELLILRGHGAELKVRLGQRQATPPANDVDHELIVKLKAVNADGSLAQLFTAWELNTPGVKAELLLLACTASGERRTEVNPLLSAAHTPLIFETFKGLLFVGFAHNLLLESYVSRLANLEKVHKGMHALTLHYTFMYKARQAEARGSRLKLRSSKRGGLRKAAKAKAAAGKQADGSANESKAKLLYLSKQVDESAGEYTNAELYKRGSAGVKRRLKAERQRHDIVKRNVAASSVANRRATCITAPSGRGRKRERTAIGCEMFVEHVEPLFNGETRKKDGSNSFKVPRQTRTDNPHPHPHPHPHLGDNQ